LRNKVNSTYNRSLFQKKKEGKAMLEKDK